MSFKRRSTRKTYVLHVDPELQQPLWLVLMQLPGRLEPENVGLGRRRTISLSELSRLVEEHRKPPARETRLVFRPYDPIGDFTHGLRDVVEQLYDEGQADAQNVIDTYGSELMQALVPTYHWPTGGEPFIWTAHLRQVVRLLNSSLGANLSGLLN